MFADDSYAYVFRRLVAATGFLPDQKTLIIAKVIKICIKIWRPARNQAFNTK